MPVHLEWPDIAIRLLCTLASGFAIGLNRGEHGRPAGLRTTMLVSLAASVAMILSNSLLATAGRPETSFITLDTMRLPLGILTGIGFIGAGAIVRRDNLVRGVTTAATLWLVTVLGLCFGAGQLWLGFAATFLCVVILTGLKRFEVSLKQDRQATLVVVAGDDGPRDDELRASLIGAGYDISSYSVVYAVADRTREMTFVVRWRDAPFNSEAPQPVQALAERHGVGKVAWTPQGR
jgi:putative Mg2+ transporter-C (MgtC) family protein